MATRTAENRDLLAKVDQLEPLGWSWKPTTDGAMIQAPHGRGSVLIHTSGSSDVKAVRAIASRLDLIGFGDDLKELAKQQAGERRARLAADRKAADQKTTAPPAAMALDFSSAGNGDVARPSVTRGMQTRTEVMTPGRAQELIDRPMTAVLPSGTVLQQRRVKAAHVLTLRDLILSDQWVVMPNGISISPDGSVLDGQHRLRAIAAAAREVEIRVTYNVPPEIFSKIDTGGVWRTGADVLQMGGVVGGNTTMASAIKLLVCYDRWRDESDSMPPWVSWSRVKVTHDEVYRAVAKYPRIAEHIRVAQQVAVPTKMVTASVAAFRQLAELEWPGQAGQDKLTDFCIDLRPDMADRRLSHDNPALTLRKWTLKTPARNITHRRELLLLLLIRHWNAYVEGKDIGLVRYTSDALMPLPYNPTAARRRARTAA